jgi:hypothetical protein
MVETPFDSPGVSPYYDEIFTGAETLPERRRFSEAYMDFSDATAKQFPLCTKFASVELQPRPLKIQKPKVWDAFVRACESERFAKIALEWLSAAGPTILPVRT